MKVAIIAGGDIDAVNDTKALLEENDFIIAADSGANHCYSMMITPHLIIGDCDSIRPEALAHFKRHNVDIIRYPREKDATDLELALDYALNFKTEKVLLLGALGGRWDMSLSNVFLAAQKKYHNLNVEIIGSNCCMSILQASRENIVHATPGQTVSFLPLSPEVTGMSLSGFKYSLSERTLSFGTSLTMSNIVTAPKATEHHSRGLLLCMVMT